MSESKVAWKKLEIVGIQTETDESKFVNEEYLLLQEIKFLQDTILHLQRSNREILEYIETNKEEEKEFLEVIEENTEIIKKRKVRIEECTRKLPKSLLQDILTKENQDKDVTLL